LWCFKENNRHYDDSVEDDDDEDEDEDEDDEN